MSLRYGRAATATAYAAFAGLVRIIATLAEWRRAVLDAPSGADALLRSAIERHRLWLKEYKERAEAEPLLTACAALSAIKAIEDFEQLCGRLASTPLPIGVFAQAARWPAGDVGDKDREKPPPELSVAFVKFQLGGQAAFDVHHLTPRELHDMEIEVRVSRWPDNATHLVLTPVSPEPRSTYEFSEFTFERPEGLAPYTLVQQGRAMLQVSQGLKARPFEFKYAASFLPSSVEQPVAVVGHRTLVVEGIDIRANPITGFPKVDDKILLIRDTLRREGGVTAAELSDVLELLTVLGSIAGRAVQDAEFDGVWSEEAFQEYVRRELRRSPRIGADLDEHPAAAGGITDLSLRGITIELKSLPKGLSDLSGCKRFIEQTASYAVAKEKRVAILCVLDCHPKNAAPRPAADGIAVLKSVSPAQVSVVTLVVQGNITRPSKLSR